MTRSRFSPYWQKMFCNDTRARTNSAGICDSWLGKVKVSCNDDRSIDNCFALQLRSALVYPVIQCRSRERGGGG